MKPALDKILAEQGIEVFIHALDLQTGKEIGHQSDTPVVAASVFKLPVLVELFRQADAGSLDLAGQVTVPVANRAPGPTGLSVMQHPVTMSWWDLALSMMVVSDNAATDFICEKVGLDAVNRTMQAFGLPGTAVPYDCRQLFNSMAEDAGVQSPGDFPRPPSPELLARLRVLNAPLTNRTTPREICRLLAMIWKDEAASPASCAHMRRILGAQVWPHRLAAGFPEENVRTAGKTGTLLTVRNEAGVVSYDDGRHYAVGVFTRSRECLSKNPAQDAAIGRAARVAVDLLASGHAA